MDDTFTCDWCGQSIAIDRRSDAVVVKCPKCGKSLMVPPVSVQTKTTQTTTTNPVKLVPGQAAPPETPSASQAKQCPFCGKAMGHDTDVCKSCGFTPKSWNPQGTVEKEPEIKRKFPTNLLVVLALLAIALLGAAVYILTAAARQ